MHAEEMAMEAAVHDDKPRQQDTSLRVEVVLENATPEARAEVVAAIERLVAEGKFGRSSVRVDHGQRDGYQVVAESLARGEERLVKWTQDGTLVPVSAVASAWGIKRQSVDAARERDEIFSVYVRGQHWYPAEALKFDRASLTKVLRCLGDQSATSKLMFLTKRHGCLGDRTPADAMHEGMLQDVLGIAEADRMS
jgi:hypothetical protein